MRHWKCRVPQGTAGSNPALSVQGVMRTRPSRSDGTRVRRRRRRAANPYQKLSVGPQRASTSSCVSWACGVFSIPDHPIALKLASKTLFASSATSLLNADIAEQRFALQQGSQPVRLSRHQCSAYCITNTEEFRKTSMVNSQANSIRMCKQ